jgi:hypothetical protein
MKSYNKINNSKPSLILDIDDTIIKSKIYILDDKTNIENIIKYNKRNYLYLTYYLVEKYLYIIIGRPFLKQFLLIMYKYFNIHIYSLGMENYIEAIINGITNLVTLNPFCNVITNTNINNKFYNKKLINFDIGYSNVLIIDDRSDVWNFDKHNLFQINPYILSDDKTIITDSELYKIIRIINLYYRYDNNKTKFNIYKFRYLYNRTYRRHIY